MTVATARCNDCHAPIWFGRTLKDKRMPLNPIPVEEGNVVVDQVEMALDQLGGTLDGARVRTLSKGERVGPDVARYVCHLATCTKRRAKRSAPRSKGRTRRGW